MGYPLEELIRDIGGSTEPHHGLGELVGCVESCTFDREHPDEVGEGCVMELGVAHVLGSEPDPRQFHIALEAGIRAAGDRDDVLGPHGLVARKLIAEKETPGRLLHRVSMLFQGVGLWHWYMRPTAADRSRLG